VELGWLDVCSRVVSCLRQMAVAQGFARAREAEFGSLEDGGARPKSRKTLYLSGGRSAKGRKKGLKLP